MIRAIIIDDEKKARETIRNMVGLYCKNTEIIGEAGNIKTAAELIHDLKPDLVFLDIRMPQGSGFDLLMKLEHIDFRVIFITAYAEYAIKAFKFSAIDYLLKPVNPDELVAAVNKVQTLVEKENLNLRLEAFMSNMDNIARDIKKIVLRTSDSIHVVNIRDIIRCEADGNYTCFYLLNEKKILVSNTLKEYDEMLTPYRFFRTHQSHLVNIDHIEKYDKKAGGVLVMKDRSEVPVSVRKKETLLTFLGKI
jgi:two-component system, LytTR family, response regulator